MFKVVLSVLYVKAIDHWSKTNVEHSDDYFSTLVSEVSNMTSCTENQKLSLECSLYQLNDELAESHIFM